jgi:endonuclease-8
VLTLDTHSVQRLGPDLLAPETSVEDVLARLRHASPAGLVGEALVDQHLVAGIGNMWLAEALWHARVSPWLRLRDVPDDDLAAVLGWARSRMRAAVVGARPPRSVYRRGGRPCRRCGALIESRGLGDANRTAYWCPSCQPSPG